MSGFVGVIHLDGAPVDPELVCHLTESLRSRGSDGEQVWTQGNVGLGHSLFRVTDEARHEIQPLRLERDLDSEKDLWIVADARVDDRIALVDALASASGAVEREHLLAAPDVELILRAYHLWGTNCLDRLLGDFSFAIWDGRQQRLFCARDHMGIRPFYYSQIGSVVVISNTLETVRRHPLVSDKLNDLAIADFLLFGTNQDSATTSFADIQRLPPAHRAIWSRNGFRKEHYWSLPIEEPLLYSSPGDYVAKFKELLRQTVSDRLRTNRVWVFMSGGLDSSTIAATALPLLQKAYPDGELGAVTHVDSLNSNERHYAGLVAGRLKIPIRYDKWDEPIDAGWENIPFRTTEPVYSPWQMLSNQRHWREMAALSRVFFYGEGPDNALLLEWRPYVRYLNARRHYFRILRDVCSTIASDWRPPFWGRFSRRLTSPPESERLFPKWVNPDLESRLRLRERWEETWARPFSPHPVHPRGYASLLIPLWQVLFARFDAGNTRAAFEVRHPYVDLRMLRFLLRVPPLPWCRSKLLLRRAMQGTLPDAVLSRKKKGISTDAVTRWVASFGFAPFNPIPDVAAYIEPALVSSVPRLNPWELYGDLRVRSLNHWLRYSLIDDG